MFDREAREFMKERKFAKTKLLANSCPLRVIEI